MALVAISLSISTLTVGCVSDKKNVEADPSVTMEHPVGPVDRYVTGGKCCQPAENSRAQEVQSKKDALELSSSRSNPELSMYKRTVRLVEVTGGYNCQKPLTLQYDFMVGEKKDANGNYINPGKISYEALSRFFNTHNLSKSGKISILRQLYCHFAGFNQRDGTFQVQASLTIENLEELLKQLCVTRHECWKNSLKLVTPSIANPVGGACDSNLNLNSK